MERDLKEKTGPGFVDNWLGIVPMAAMAVAIVFFGLAGERFFDPQNASTLALNMSIYVLPALGFALTMRANGPDISLLALTPFTSMILGNLIAGGMQWGAALLAALAVSAGIGAANALLSKKLPGAVATLITAVALLLVNKAVIKPVAVLLEGMPLLENAFPIIICAAAGVFLLTFFMKPGTLKERKRGLALFVPYIVSSLLGCFASFVVIMRLRAWHSMSFSTSTLLPFLLFLAGCLYSTRLAGKKAVLVPYTLIAVWAWCALFNAMILASVNPFNQLLMQLLFIAAFGAIAIIVAVRGKKKQVLPL